MTTFKEDLDSLTGTVSGTSIKTLLQAGESYTGVMGGYTNPVYATLVRPADTVNYTAGDEIGSSTVSGTMIEFPNFSRLNNTSGYITSGTIGWSKQGLAPRLSLALYNDTIPAANIAADNAGRIEKASDHLKYIGTIDFDSMYGGADTINSNYSHSQAYTLNMPFRPATTSRSIYGCLFTNDSIGPGSADTITIMLNNEGN